MAKFFNVNGICRPDRHYMVDLGIKLKKIKAMIEHGQYFTINRARQYGKTTTLRALSDYLKDEYTVVSLDFQKLSSLDFENESAFVNSLAREVLKRIRTAEDIPDKPKAKLLELAEARDAHTRMAEIFDCFSDWCGQSKKPIVLIIDEVDTATNNQVFLDFLAQLRAAYLVSSLCKLMDEEIAGTADFPDKGSAWTKLGFMEAEKLLLAENNTLFQSLTGKLADYPELQSVLYDLLFKGRPIPYVPQNQYIDVATMFGFIKNKNGSAVISNRIFESVLYNLFISEEFSANKMYDAGE